MHNLNVTGFMESEHIRGGGRGSIRNRKACDWWEKKKDALFRRKKWDGKEW